MADDKTPAFFPENVSSEEMVSIQSETVSVLSTTFEKILPSELTSSGSFNFEQIGTSILDRLLEALPLPVILVDHSGGVIAMNTAASGMTGGSFLSLFVSPEDSLKAESLMERVWAERSPLTAEALLQAPGKRFWARLHFRSLRLQAQRLVLVLMEDLTTEKSGAFLNEKYGKLIRMFPTGIAEFKCRKAERIQAPIKDLMAVVLGSTLVGGNFEFASMHGGSNIKSLTGRAFESFATFLDACELHLRTWIAEGFDKVRFMSSETIDELNRTFENTLVGNVNKGLLEGFWVYRRDTTEEETRRVALNKNEQLVLKIFEENPLGMAIVSRAGEIQTVNEAMCQILGYTKSELISRDFSSLGDPGEREQIDNAPTPTGSDVSSRKFERELRKKDNSFVTVNMTELTLRDDDGRKTHSLIMVENITDRKKANELVHLLTAAVEQSSEGICVTDLTGSVIFVNRAFAELHQFSTDELIGRHQSFFHPAQDMLSLVAAKRRLTQVGEFSGEIRHLKADGSVFPGLLHSTLIHDPSGNPVAVINAVRDISEIKTTEHALRAGSEKLAEYSQFLESKIGERTRILEETKKQIETYEKQLKKAEDALKILITGVEEQKKSVENKILDNFRSTLRPILNRLKTEDLSRRVREVVDLLDGTLESLGARPQHAISVKSHLLTLKELRICEMIGSGLTSKEIAKILGVSPHTVFLHRSNIRKKLGLIGNDDDLASYLSSTREKNV